MVSLCLLNPQMWLEVKSAASLLTARGLGALVKSTVTFRFLLLKDKREMQNCDPISALESSCIVQSLLHLERPIFKAAQRPILLLSRECYLINCFSIVRNVFWGTLWFHSERDDATFFSEWALSFNLNSSFTPDIFTVCNHLHSQLWLSNPSSWDS